MAEYLNPHPTDTAEVAMYGPKGHPDRQAQFSPVAFNVNGAGFKGGTVAGLESGGLVGCYCNGKPYAPRLDAIRAMLPYRWRAAWDRDHVAWWPDNAAYCYIRLTDRRGRELTTVYAHGHIKAGRHHAG